jgi:uncharacterized RDD family membrane protein YckC
VTDQERPSEPESQPGTGGPTDSGQPPDATPPVPPVDATPPGSDQPTVGWTPPLPPSSQPVPPSWGASATSPSPAPTPDPSQPGWGAPPPPPAQPTWGAAPPPPPPSTGPLLSSTPTPSAGWTQPTFGQQEVAPGLVFSGTLARFVAYLIDGFLLAIIGGVVGAVFGEPRYVPGSGFQGTQFTTGSFLTTLISVAIGAAYFIGFWSGGRRATLGQMLLKIQVGNAFDGKPLTTTQAAKRWLALGEWLQAFAVSAGSAAALGGLGAIWALVLLITTATSPTKQGLHDRFANSAVVRPVGASNAIVWGCLFIFVILPILLFIGLFSLIFVGGQVSTILSAVGESV